MPIPVACPSCNAGLRAPDAAAGRKTKCPRCGTGITVPAPTVETAGPPAAKSDQPAAPEPAAASGGPPVVRREGRPAFVVVPDEDDAPLARRPRRRPVTVATQVVVHPPSRAAHSLGIASLVVGVLSFFVCWVPLVGAAVGGLGLALGVGGLFVALARKGGGAGFAVAGSGLSALSLCVSLVWTLALGSAFHAVDKAVTDARAERERTNQQVVPGGDATAPEVGDAESSPAAGAAAGDGWADATAGAVQQGDIRVRLVAAEVGYVTGTDFREFKSDQPHLKIVLSVENTSASRKAEYRGWGDGSGILASGAASLADDLGNGYKRVNFGLGSKIDGQVRSASIYPGKSITDTLVFEAPVDTAKFLRLELPAENFGGAGKLRLQIPATAVQRR